MRAKQGWQDRNLPLSRRHIAAKAPMSPVKNQEAFDDIRNGIRAIMRLSFDKLLQLGYSRDNAQVLLLRMTRGVVSHLDAQQA
jgi:hypothetical protein